VISFETYSREVVAITKLPFSSHAKKTTQQEVKNVDKIDATFLAISLISL
jgi:hypothetical protein